MLRQLYPGVPLMALTATATPKTVADTKQQLHMQQSKLYVVEFSFALDISLFFRFISSFDRPNLHYSVESKSGTNILGKLCERLKRLYNKQSGIFYCLSRYVVIYKLLLNLLHIGKNAKWCVAKCRHRACHAKCITPV
jgi:bloom syndrome protein